MVTVLKVIVMMTKRMMIFVNSYGIFLLLWKPVPILPTVILPSLLNWDIPSLLMAGDSFLYMLAPYKVDSHAIGWASLYWVVDSDMML